MAAPAQHTAVIFRKHGDASVLEVVKDWPTPTRQPGEVLIEQYSSSVNPVDTAVRKAPYRAEAVLPKVPGGDIAGKVIAADPDSRFKPGDRVFGLAAWFFSDSAKGGYAEYVSVPEEWLAFVPPNLSLSEAGGVPLVALTAWQALEKGNIKPGDRGFVHAGAGGVGVYATQLAKQAWGAHVVSSAGPNNQEFLLKELRVDEAFNYRTQKQEDLPPQSFDFIFDVMGNDNDVIGVEKLLKPTGFYTMVANARINKDRVAAYMKAGEEGKGPRFFLTIVQPSGEKLQKISDLIRDGKVKPIVDSVFPLEKAKEAHERVEDGHARGKVVLQIKQE